PVLGAGDDGAEGDHDEVLQQVQAPVGPARVLQCGEVLANRQIGRPVVRRGGRGGHESPPWAELFRENRRSRPLTKSTGREESGRCVAPGPCPSAAVGRPIRPWGEPLKAVCRSNGTSLSSSSHGLPPGYLLPRFGKFLKPGSSRLDCPGEQ